MSERGNVGLKEQATGSREILTMSSGGKRRMGKRVASRPKLFAERLTPIRRTWILAKYSTDLRTPVD